ncbi:hypothetical protein D3C87_2018140 [compost metagenome]
MNLSMTVTRPSRPRVEMKAKASGTPAKLDATPEKVMTAARSPSGRRPRMIASAIARPTRAPNMAEAPEMRIEIQ